jgi:hypothetical protein
MRRKSKPAIPTLILSLKDQNELVRVWAVEALGNIGPDANAAVPQLIEGLQNTKDRSAHWAIALALGGIGPAAKEAVPSLVKALQEKDDSLRESVVIALGRIGPDAKAAVPALIAVAKDKRNTGRRHAIEALGKIGPEARAAMPVLIEALAAPEPYLAFHGTVAKALGGIGPGAKAAVPALAAIARDRFADSSAREAAAQAVMKIDPEFAAEEGVELAYLDVRLGKVPNAKLAPRAPVTEERKRRIKQLIAELANVADPDVGISATLTGQAFAPLPDQEHVGMMLLTDHGVKSARALRSLVETGPEALPFLLDALSDKTRTKLKVESLLMMGFGTELAGNPLNPLERRVLPKATADEDDEDDDRHRHPYTVKVGDVCFVAIGQIVGRPYNAVRYQPTAIVVINSPLVKTQLRERVRAIWSSNDPAQKLLDSLLLDYATEGIFSGKSLDGWSQGSGLQVQAAMRLLYYFPRETFPLIAARLRSLDVQEVDWMKREVKNGVRTAEFIQAVSWCTAPAIREALADVAKRTNDPAIKVALEGGREKNP